MEFEFKEYIRDEILSNINHMNILDDALDELDHVYAQAAKADEYEAKAKAWGVLRRKLHGKNKSILTNKNATEEDLDFVGNNTAVLWEMSDLEMKFRKEKESGEPDAKK